MSLQTLLNPFTRIAGFSALLYGCFFMLLTAAIAAPCGVNFVGSLNIHVARPMPFMLIFSLLILGWLVAATCFYIAGLLFSPSKIRAVDVFGTFALARTPFLMAALSGLLPGLANFDPLQPPPVFWVFAAIALLVDIWVVILSYNAFAVSANVKSKWLFTGVFVVSEIVAVILSILLTAGLSVASAKAPTLDDAEHVEIAQKFVERFFAHPDENLFEELQATEKMKGFFTPAAVKHWSNKIVNDYGQLGDCVKVEVVRHNQRSRSVFLFFQGERSPVKMWVTFDDKLISGFHYNVWAEGYAKRERTRGVFPGVLKNMSGTETFVWGCILIPMFITSLLLLRGKGAFFLIGGDYFISKEVLAKYDEKAMSRFIGLSLLWMTCCVILLLFSIHSGIAWMSYYAVGIITVSACALVIYASTENRFYKKGFRKEKRENNNLWLIASEKIRLCLVAIAVFLGIPAVPVFVSLKEKEPTVEIIGGGIEISGDYGLRIDFTKVTDISLMENHVRLTRRTNGYATPSTQRGYFLSDEYGSVLVFRRSGPSPTIHIKRNDKEDVFLKLNNEEATRTLYNEMKTAFIHRNVLAEGRAEREPPFLEKLAKHPLTWWLGSAVGVVIMIVGGYYVMWRHNYDWGQSLDP